MLNPELNYRDATGSFVPDGYSYVVNFTGITGAAPVATQTIQTQNDADFSISRFLYFFIDAAAATETVTTATQEIPDMTVQITDSATSKNLFFAPIQVHLLASNNFDNLVELPAIKNIKAGASLTIAIASTKTFVNTYNLQLVLAGYKKLRIRA